MKISYRKYMLLRVKLIILLFCFFNNSCYAEKIIKSNKVKESPNILFLFTDDHRYGTIGKLKQDFVKTPSLDRLTENGVMFSNAYILGAPHPAVCCPSRAMLMTGRNYFSLPNNVFVPWDYSEEEFGDCDLLTFPEFFRAHGYKTFATGKQHNGKYWVERGFDKAKSVFMGGMSTHFGIEVSDFDHSSGWSKPYADNEKFSSNLFADAAIGFLQDYKEKEPFLMYVSFTAPHDPRTAPDEFHKMYPKEQIKLPPNVLPEHPFKIEDMKIRDEMLAGFPRKNDEIKNHISDYYAMISSTDVQIGRILEALKKSGKAENTIIVFAGDNGLALGQHGLLGKQNLYEHSIKIPLLFCGPGIKKNERKDALVYLHDIFPTLCGLTGLDTPESVQTKNLAPVLMGNKEKVRDVLYFSYSSWPSYTKGQKDFPRGGHRAVRKGNWKLILSSYEGIVTPQLFNLKEDPWETNNLINKQEYIEKKAELLLELKKQIKNINDPAQIKLGKED